MLSRLKDFYKLFLVGHQVADPKFWKQQQAVVQPIIASLIMLVVTIVKGFGYDLPVSDDLAFIIAGALFFIVNSVLTIITSRKIGLRANQSPMPSVQQATVETTQTEAVQDEYNTNLEHNSIDESTRKRAEQYAKQQSSNGLANDA